MKKKVLLVEDELILTKTYKLAFEQAGYDVIIIEKAEMALKTAQREKPNLIVLDLVFYNSHGQLSKEPGFTALTALKKNTETKDIPVVIFTNLSENDRNRAIALGAQDYITKLEAVPKEVVHNVEKFIK
ncbi:MAG: response regulator [bacterium]